MTATVHVRISKPDINERICVPLSAVFEKVKQPHVWIYKDGVVKSREVDISQIDSESAVIESGLKIGEEIVVAGAHYLHEDMHVKVYKEELR
jgi:multidrug efflux pump subunit AcrA (membrane-fusion protein)